MHKSKLLIVLSILTVLALLLSACAQVATTEAPAPTEAAKPTEAPRRPTPQTHRRQPLRKPPSPLKKSNPLRHLPQKGLPEGVKTILVVHLNKGLKWSDGTEVTARDLVGSYQVYWAQQAAIWGFLKDVVAKDDYTVEFWLTNPSPRSLRLVLRSNQFAPCSVSYAKWMDQFAKLRQDGKAADSEETTKVLDDLYAFKPEKPVVYGPYILDPGSVTEAQLELVKNPSGYNASKIDLEKVLVYYGETTASMPLVLSVMRLTTQLLAIQLPM